MSIIKRVLFSGIILISIILAMLAIPQVICAQEKDKLIFSTATSTGVYYMLGSGVGEVVSKHTGINVEVQTSQGSIANLNLLTEKLVDMAWVGGSAFVQLVIEEDKDVSDLRFMGFGPSSGVQLIARKDSGIKNVRDLEGKTVSVGAPATSGATVQAEILKTGFGLTDENYNPVYLSFNEVIDGLRDKVIDAGIITMAVPSSLVIDLSTTIPVQLLEWDDKGIEKIVDRFPSYRKVLVPKGTYNGVDEDVPIIAGPAGITLCQADLSEDIIYEFVKAAFEHYKEISNINAAGRELTFENTISILESNQGKAIIENIEIHPGLLKYMEEKNYKIESK